MIWSLPQPGLLTEVLQFVNISTHVPAQDVFDVDWRLGRQSLDAMEQLAISIRQTVVEGASREQGNLRSDRSFLCSVTQHIPITRVDGK
jgi:hypothetical protein